MSYDELSSLATCLSYGDFRRKLARKLGWRILVKENPQQIGYQRGKWFYERLAGIPQVELVPRKLDTYELLRRCRFAATITGTIGWESITRRQTRSDFWAWRMVSLPTGCDIVHRFVPR